MKGKRECEFELEHFKVAQSLTATSTGSHISLGSASLSMFFIIPKPHNMPGSPVYFTSLLEKLIAPKEGRKDTDEKISIPLPLINSDVWVIGPSSF